MTSVCILTSAHSPFDQRIFHKQAQTLESAGYDVTIVAHHDQEEFSEGIHIVPIAPSESELERTLDLFKIYRKAKSIEADVYHFHDPTLLPIGAALSHRTDAKVVYDVHEDYTEKLPVYGMTPDWSIPLINRFWPAFESKMAAQVDGIIGATEHISNFFRDRGHDHVATVHNYPIISNVSEKQTPVERESEHVLIYTGGITELRGLTPMLNVTSRLNEEGYDVSLWLLGPVGLDGGEEELIRRIEDGHSDYVRFLGEVDHSEVYSYQKKGDIGLILMPEQLDGRHYQIRGLPTKMLEYMYAELPVVATSTDGIKRYLPEKCGITVPSNDIKAQADAIRKLLNSSKKRESMGSAGRKVVEEGMSWESESEELLKFYDQLLD